ncbi:MAG: hypothetical protein KIT11_01210 [Fimbriimonadaceae bacterium]|nr:hypothetical protein [Fimbriimonadaceae bacterium]QYK55007.1 MAG: hypothetical protein KF733_08325 [Fimbriimonadaceae bacterium]
MVPAPQKPSPEKRRTRVLLVSVALFLASCALPCLHWQNGDSMFGWEVLLLGWMGVLYGQLAWFANPLYALAMLCSVLSRGRWVTLLSLGCVFVGLLTVTLFFTELPADEANVNKLRLQSLGPAAWLWMGSFLTLVYANGRRDPIRGTFQGIGQA